MSALQRLSARLNTVIRATVGLTQDPPVQCLDNDLAYLPVESVARLVHGDLATMLPGGIASLYVQMLHPRAIAGVAQHSRYRDDPLGRMLQTANFIGKTTYGTRLEALAVIERVKAVHEAVRGVTDQGEPYAAGDPDLLLFVHCAEISMFLAAYRRWGLDTLSDAEADQYVSEMASLANDLGTDEPPRTVAELNETLASFSSALRLSADAVAARDWLRYQIYPRGWRKWGFALVSTASVSLMTPAWRSMIGFPRRPLREFLSRPLFRIFVAVVHLVVPPLRRVTSSASVHRQ